MTDDEIREQKIKFATQIIREVVEDLVIEDRIRAIRDALLAVEAEKLKQEKESQDHAVEEVHVRHSKAEVLRKQADEQENSIANMPLNTQKLILDQVKRLRADADKLDKSI
jgi:hypothetical protein